MRTVVSLSAGWVESEVEQCSLVVQGEWFRKERLADLLALWASMVAEFAEEGASEPDTTWEKFVGDWVEMEVAEQDLGKLEGIRSDTEQSVKAIVLAGNVGLG